MASMTSHPDPASSLPETRITHLSPRDLRVRREECPVAWIPLGTIEWHGKHMPLGTDGLQAEGLCRHAAAQIGGVTFPALYVGDHRGITVEVLAAPGVWPGDAEGRRLTYDHRIEIAREMGVTAEGFLTNAVRDDARIGGRSEQYVELVERAMWTARSYGFSRIVVVPGHGGTLGPAADAVQRFNDTQSASTGLSGQDAFIAEAEVSHGSAWETSTILYLHPELIQFDNLASEPEDEPAGVSMPRLERHPRFATSDWGRRTVETFVERIRRELGEIPPSVHLADPDEDGTPGDWTTRVQSWTRAFE
jgi:creatinine amidohydrolase